MKRARLLAFLLPLLLCLAQGGAAIHGIQHWQDDQSRQEKSLPDKACEQCAAYAPLVGALKANVAAFVPGGGVAEIVPAAPSIAVFLRAVGFRPRAPPAPL